MSWGAPISNAASFHDEARYQRVCAVCGQPGPFHAHHIVPEQQLRRLHLPTHDTRNALRLCVGCHMAYEWAGPGKVAVEARHLTDVAFCYIWSVLGISGEAIGLKRYDAVSDERWQRHLEHRCLECQA